MFSKSFVTLFHVTAGDPWPEHPSLLQDDGTVDWAVAGFHMAYNISVDWVILEARAARGARDGGGWGGGYRGRCWRRRS